jgi:hypothetical protein
VVGFVVLGAALIALGLRTDTWWTVLGGISSLAAAAWWTTESV